MAVEWGMGAHTYNHSTWEDVAGDSQVLCQPSLQSENLSQKNDS
jgi:hypothetical protein